jgi:hypothetical protein
MPYVIESPTQERLTELWPQIKPLFKRCCDEAARGELDEEDIRALHAAGDAVVFVELDTGTGQVTIAIAMEFIHYPKYTAANVFALGGHGLASARTRFWPQITDWLKQNNIYHIDAWVSDSVMRMLKRMMGFNKIYNHVRLDLTQE